MSRHTTSLNDTTWQFGQVERRSFNAPTLFDLPAVQRWLPATVPGNVRTDLLALHRIPDPFFGEGYKHSLWVEDVDWWYRRTVQTDDLAPGQRAFLRFHGIDYLSAIFINGVEAARHHGMFSHQTIEITDDLHAGPVDLAVRLWGSSALPRRKLSPLQKLWQKFGETAYRSWVGIYPDRTATLKCQMSFGWDFAPSIRTMGIWDDLELLISGPVIIRELGIRSQGIGASDQQSALSLQLALDSDFSTPAIAVVTIEPANFQGDAFGPFEFKLHLPAARSDVLLRCPLPRVKPWQPWDRGFPHLYRLTVTLTTSDGAPLDSLSHRTGFRTIERQGWQFAINGQPEFLRGLNWVPADSFPGRLRPADYEWLLTAARATNANLLRVWGGGLREKRTFYDLCDELGLLVWQEFPFACEFLGAFPRHADYLAFVERECSHIVRQLRHHPSLLLWCGGNEFSRSRNQPLLQTLARVVRQHDGARPFVPVSPGPGDAHNWHVWHGLAPIAAYRRETAAMLSEFGLQSLPHLDTLIAISGSDAQSAMPGTAGQALRNSVLAHHGDPAKLARYANLFNEKLEIRNEKIDTSPSTIHHSQSAQAVGLQTAIEHMRRRKAEAGGVAVWQFNEPWPAISWAILDYFGRPKLAYERLKTWYAPLLVSLDFPVGHRWQPGDDFIADIWLINDSLAAYSEVNLDVTLTTADQTSLTLHNSQFAIQSNRAVRVGRLEHRFSGPPQHITTTLRHGDDILAKNHYPLTWRNDSRPHPFSKIRRWLAEWVLK